MVYNETVNLPIWLRYYGSNFGSKNLYVIDRDSTDSSTADLGDANKIRLPRDAFDEYKRSKFISSFHECLLQYYDTVIFTDTDEILVPDLSHYANLADYVDRREFDYASAVGLNVSHAIHVEDPIDLNRPLLAQRKYARFFPAQCKTLISRVPLVWLPGFHSTNRRPKLDPDLFIFHIKLIDFYEALHRQKVNRETEWAAASLDQNLGGHHRWETERFVREGFFTTIDLMNRGLIAEFDFTADIADLYSKVMEKDGFHYIPMGPGKLVEIPDHLRSAF
jgi:hypothetical protein